ncbi:MAG: hypothetical protein GC185_07470 [Alphaproteobacteria bacterium]|nr:hypothetical protein [Alphaproteobacteria bacterium]
MSHTPEMNRADRHPPQAAGRISPQFFDSAQGRNPARFTSVPPLQGRLADHFTASVPPGAIPPVPPPDRGDWTVEIPGKGYARPPVQVDFAGTISHERPDPYASPAKKAARKKRLEAEELRNEKVLEEAVFILSQSPTGRDVLEQMTKEGYRIVFDDRRTGERGAGGLCDPSDKLIILRGHDNPEYLALLLGHESVHAVQNTRHDMFPSTRHKPEVGIKMSFAIEADAYAQQSQIALELAYGDPDGPDDQLRMDGPLLQMRERFPDIIHAAERVLSDEESMQNGKSVAAAFEAFYDNFYLRTFYEDAHIEWAEAYAPRLKGSFPWLQRHFSNDTDSQWIKDRIQHRGKSYLNDHLPNMTFDDARHSGVTAETGKRIEKFYENHMPKGKKPLLKRFGVHMRNAVEAVLGLTTSVRAVIKDRDDTPKGLQGVPPRRNHGP